MLHYVADINNKAICKIEREKIVRNKNNLMKMEKLEMGIIYL